MIPTATCIDPMLARGVSSSAERPTWWFGAAGLWIVAALYGAAGLVVSILLHRGLHMFVWDIGVFDQVVWNTAHGRWFESSIEVSNFLGDHFAPILALPALLHPVVPAPLSLMLLQNACYTVSAALVGTMILRRTGRRDLAWGAALLLWCHPSSFGAFVDDFHVLPFVVPAVLGVYCSLERRRWGWAALCIVTTCAIREDAPLALAGLGVVLLGDVRLRRVGAGLIVFGIAVTAAAQWWWIPWFRGAVADSNHRMVWHQADTLIDLGRLTVGAPAMWTFLAGFFLFLAGAPLWAGWRALGIVLAMGHLFVTPSTLALERHYSAVPLAVAAVVMLIVYTTVLPRRMPRGSRAARVLLAVSLCSAGLFLWRDGRGRAWVLRPNPRVADFAAVAHHLPPDAAVAASTNIGSRLTHRRALYLWPAEEYANMNQPPAPIERATYIFTDAHRETVWKRSNEIAALRSDGRYEVVAERGDFTLFRRIEEVDTAGHREPLAF